MRTKGARNRTPEERVQLVHANRLAAAARKKLPSLRESHVLDAINTMYGAGASVADIVRIIKDRGHKPMTIGHVKSAIRGLTKKGLLKSVRQTVLYIAIPR